MCDGFDEWRLSMSWEDPTEEDMEEERRRQAEERRQLEEYNQRLVPASD